MKLLELVSYFRNGGSYEEFCQLQSLDQQSEVVEIYMKNPLKFDNDLKFFEIEKTEGIFEYESDGVIYSNLFDFYYFLEAIEESKNKQNQSFSDEEIARLLYNYAINDA
ncbi:hypothetical protein DRF59_19970 [Chryseobacterium flavum]|uniref:Uncharacterized protein n=1 Tax=Chryseobacterium flavum TaxID=415851 RepID=A0A3D9CG37_9FLAO|nr:hypothetical protein [Chryseobacterium flavum]REC64632.1 hypothetical protein DRF59_19970 [Chryseobacterium flavum]